MNLPYLRYAFVIALAIDLSASRALPSDNVPLPPAPALNIVTIAPPGGNYTEPSIAVNPKDPNQVVAVYQGGESAQGSASAAFSRDGGKSFVIASGTKPPDWKVAGDVTTTFDNQGHAFLCYLAFDKLGTTSYWAHNAGRNGIFVRRSPDGGKTWDKDATAIRVWPTGHEPNIQFEDEPRIFADNGARSPYAGNLYVGWVEWQIDKSIMLFSRSIDGGETWSNPLQISTHPGLPRDDNGSLGGFMQAVGPDGTIHAIWQDGNSIVLAHSKDGGRTFHRPRPTIQTGPIYFGEVPGISRVEGFPQIAVFGRSLYLTWSDYTNGDVDVFLSRSDDGGSTWSKPVRVNDDPIHDGCDQFLQWLAVDDSTGDLYVQFYDRRSDPSNRLSKMTISRSTDGGSTFKNYAWTTNPFEGRGIFWGDYTWLSAHAGRVYGIWTEVIPPPESNQQTLHPKPTTIIRVGTADFSKPGY